MKIRSNSARLAIAAAALAMSGAANAVLLSSGSPSTNFSWSYNTGTSLLTGFGSISLSGFNSSSLTAAISLSNTSLLGGQGGERLTAFGFGIDPNVTGVSFSDAQGNDGGMIGAAAGSLPSLGNIEVCSRSGPNCNGGGNGGIYAGLSDAFNIIMAGTWGSSVNIDPIGIRYQTGYGSFTFTTSASSSTTTTSSTSSTGGTTTSSTSSGTTTSSTTSSTTSTSSGTTTSTSSGTIAEPATGSMALLGLGLLGFALRRTRGVEKA